MTNTVLVTGCSSGFGEAAVNLFAMRGWTVVATMRNPDDGRPLTTAPRVSSEQDFTSLMHGFFLPQGTTNA